MKTILLITLCTFITVSTVRAQEPEPTLDPAVTSTIKERVQKVIESENSVAGVESSAQSSFGIIGTLEKNVGSTLQIRSVQGKLRIVELDRSAVFLQNGRAITREELELNRPVVITGSLDGNGAYVGKRLVVSDDKIFPKERVTIWGTLLASTTKSLTLDILGKNQGTQTVIPVTTLTRYYNIVDQTIRRTDLKPSEEVVIVLPPGESATVSAQRVYSLSTPTSTLPPTP